MADGVETGPAAPVAKKVNLFDLESARREVKAWIEEETAANEGELPEWLEALELETEEALDQKIDRLRGFIMSQRVHIQTIDSEVVRLETRKKVRQGRIDRLTRYVQVVMDAAGTKKVETALGTVSRRGNGGNRPWEFLAPVDQLQQDERTAPFVKEVKPLPYFELDKDALRKALEADGVDELKVPLFHASGAPIMSEDGNTQLFGTIAKLGERGESVQFK